MITPNQISDAFQSQLGRAPTDYEIKTYATASPQTIATLKDSYGKLNTNQSIVDYAKANGIDPATIPNLAKTHGITNVGTAAGNTALLNALKSGNVPSVGGSISKAPIAPLASVPLEQVPGKTPQEMAAELQQKAPGAATGEGSLDPTATIPGSISAAATPPTPIITDTSNPLSDPTISAQKDTYVSAQKNVADITKQIADLQNTIDGALSAKREQIAASGGVVNEAQLRSEVLTENAPLIAQLQALKADRTQAVSEQSIAGKDYQTSIADFYKSLTAKQAEEKITQAGEKMDIQQQQFSDKLEQAGWKSTKVNITDAAGNVLGQKIVWSQNPAETSANNSASTITTSAGSGGIKNGVTNSGNITTTNPPKITITDGGSPEQVLQSLTTGKPVVYKGSTIPVTQQTLYNLAIADLIGSTSTAGGRTPSALIPLVKDKETDIMNAYNLTPLDIATAKAQFKNLSATNAKLLERSSFTNLAASIATDNLQLAIDASKNVPRGGAKIVNKYKQWVQGNFTPAGPLAELETYVYTYAREYAKVTSGAAQSVAGLTDSAQAEAEKLLSAAQAPETFATVAKAMGNDMKNVMDENNKAVSTFPDSVKKLYGMMGTAGDKNAFTPRGSMSASDFVEKTLSSQGMKYDDVVAKYTPSLKSGEQLALDNNTGEVVAATKDEITSGAYTPL